MGQVNPKAGFLVQGAGGGVTPLAMTWWCCTNEGEKTLTLYCRWIGREENIERTALEEIIEAQRQAGEESAAQSPIRRLKRMKMGDDLWRREKEESKSSTR